MSKTLEELGYQKLECEDYVAFGGRDKEILFDKQKKEFTGEKFVSNGIFVIPAFTMEELKAIYKWCEDNKWI